MDAGKIIKHCRKSAGLTQKELAERIFVSVTTIGNYESEWRDAPYATMQEVAKACGYRIYWKKIK